MRIVSLLVMSFLSITNLTAQGPPFKVPHPEPGWPALPPPNELGLEEQSLELGNPAMAAEQYAFAMEKQAAKMEKQRDRMEIMAIWRLTEDLKLTEEQAEKLFPKIRQHREDLKKIDEEQHEIMKSLLEKAERGDEITNKEYSSTIKSVFELEKKKIENKEKFLNEMEGTLNNIQRVKLTIFQEQLKQDIRKRIREHLAPKEMRPYRDRRDKWR